jgi:hypothetical protein
MNALNVGIGINCKTLLLLFWALIAIKLVARADFIDPAVLLPDGSEITQMAVWMWKYALVVIGELLLGLGYAVLFEDDDGHELVVVTTMIMSAVAVLSIHPVLKYTSDWVGTLFGFSALWVQLGFVILLCNAAIAGGRCGSGRHYRPFSGYHEITTSASCFVK